MELAQQWASLIGLVMDFYGVLLLTREFPFIFGRGFRRFVVRIRKRHLRVAQMLQRKHAKIVSDRAREKRRWLHWLYDVGIWGLRRRSRTEARHMNDSAAKFEAPSFTVVDSNGILDPVAVQRFADHLHEYVDDLVENGEARDLSVQGLKWVLGGLGLQIFGNLPLPW